ncbi:hypothetical protein CDAR_52181 [Caerostris darwini]|uniref:Uncharacterized protein n=1 Tax=Caerostris darwini TaxID=1538125 RepID=A0AAV4PZV6_9ARAC|nr:hypothetical protein CDAR_52181 [Caerostris darwini]
MEFDMECFTYALFVCQYDSKTADLKMPSLTAIERPILKRAVEAINKMNEIYGRIFDDYFKKLNENGFFCSTYGLTRFVLKRCPDFCQSPSFYNFLLVCLFLYRLIKSHPECFLLVETVAKCMLIIYTKQYEEFFEANGSLNGMLKYLDEIKEEDLRSFISRNANSENGGILIPTFEDVLKIVNKFNDDYMLQEWQQDYLYEFQYPFEEESHKLDNNFETSDYVFYLMKK